ncbi:MAG: hypothetical protein JJU20_00020 [Opitutales bacterium]|nr:hypothetical protein [Opitutales bacterium]
MNIIKRTGLILSATLFLASFAFGQQARTTFPGAAQSGDMPREGSREVTFAGSGESDRKFDNGSLSLEGSYGWYTTDRWLISLRQTVNNLGNSRNWSGSTIVAADYHFLDGPWRPFIGANTGFRYGGRSVGDSFAAGVQTGMKYYVHGGAFLFGRAEYSYTFDSVSDVEDAWDRGRWGYAFGMGLNF